jgi:hypothetical protein
MDKDNAYFLPKSDSLLNNACLPNNTFAAWVLYIEGYKVAAQTIVDSVCLSHNDQDMLLYPIWFLYRHHIELFVKIILRLCELCLNEI